MGSRPPPLLTCFLIIFKDMILLLSSLLIKAAVAANPAEDLQNCLQTNSVLDDCLKEIVVNMGGKYKAGVPELGLPALDPLVMPGIELNLGNSKVKFEDIVANGLSRFNVKSVNYDKASNSIKLSMVFDNMESTGKYTVTVLGTSSGPYNNTYSSIAVDSVAKLMKKGNTVEVDNIDMKIAVGQIKVQLKCLFPKEDTCPSPDSFSLEEMKGSTFAENCCCSQNTDKGENMSCTPLLAKTTHRTINKSGRGNLVERFQPQITGSVGGLVKNYLNGSFRQVDASVFFF